MTDCTHHYILEDPAPGKTEYLGVCKLCGHESVTTMRRDFPHQYTVLPQSNQTYTVKRLQNLQ